MSVVSLGMCDVQSLNPHSYVDHKSYQHALYFSISSSTCVRLCPWMQTYSNNYTPSADLLRGGVYSTRSLKKMLKEDVLRLGRSKGLKCDVENGEWATKKNMIAKLLDYQLKSKKALNTFKNYSLLSNCCPLATIIILLPPQKCSPQK